MYVGEIRNINKFSGYRLKANRKSWANGMNIYFESETERNDQTCIKY